MVVAWFLSPSQNDDYYFNNVKVLDSLNSNYDKFLLIDGFYSEGHQIEIEKKHVS